MERKRDFSWLKNWRVLTLSSGCLLAGFLAGMLIFGSQWHLPAAWGDIPTWISAIASVGLFIGAVITAIYAARALGKQSQEVGALLKENKRQARERRRTQAAHVFTGVPGDDRQYLYAKNGSEFPIFGAQFWYTEPGGASGPDDSGSNSPKSHRQIPQKSNCADRCATVRVLKQALT
jgi:hypothetical protein